MYAIISHIHNRLFGCFRMEKLVQTSAHEPVHIIHAMDAIYLEHTNTIPIFLDTKNWPGATLTLSSTIRPLRTMWSFMQLKPISQQNCCHFSDRPMTIYQVTSVFYMSISSLELDKQVYKTHSFCIATASSVCSWELANKIFLVGDGGNIVVCWSTLEK